MSCSRTSRRQPQQPGSIVRDKMKGDKRRESGRGSEDSLFVLPRELGLTLRYPSKAVQHWLFLSYDTHDAILYPTVQQEFTD